MKKFAFIIHPLSFNDIENKFPVSRLFPNRVLKNMGKFLPPFKISKITGIKSITGAQTQGWFIVCPLTSRQMINMNQDKVINKIVACCKKADKLGADIVGLGAFTAVVGDKGKTISKKSNLPVTTGNSYTVATALKGIERACNLLKRRLEDSKVLIVGAAGSIGRICSFILADKVSKLFLADIRARVLDELALKIVAQSKVEVISTTDYKDLIPEADIVLTVSSAIDSLIEPKLFKTGAIVCDVARPRDIGKEVLKRRKDILVIDGGIVDVPGKVNFNFDFGFPFGTAYACMAETMMLALENKCVSYSLGNKLELDKIIEMNSLADKHGFKLSGLRSQGKKIKFTQINRIRRINN